MTNDDQRRREERIGQPDDGTNGGGRGRGGRSGLNPNP